MGAFLLKKENVDKLVHIGESIQKDIYNRAIEISAEEVEKCVSDFDCVVDEKCADQIAIIVGSLNSKEFTKETLKLYTQGILLATAKRIRGLKID